VKGYRLAGKRKEYRGGKEIPTVGKNAATEATCEITRLVRRKDRETLSSTIGTSSRSRLGPFDNPGDPRRAKRKRKTTVLGGEYMQERTTDCPKEREKLSLRERGEHRREGRGRDAWVPLTRGGGKHQKWLAI